MQVVVREEGAEVCHEGGVGLGREGGSEGGREGGREGEYVCMRPGCTWLVLPPFLPPSLSYLRLGQIRNFQRVVFPSLPPYLPHRAP